jgi:large subunit ribosomal protein L4
LVVIKENDENTILSARNIANANTALADNINVYDIMNAKTLVLAKDAVEKIQEVYA